MIIGQILGILLLSAIGIFFILLILMLFGMDIPSSFFDGQTYYKDRNSSYLSDHYKNEYAKKNFVSQYVFSLGYSYEKTKQDQKEVNIDERAERLEKLLDKYK